MRRWSLDRRGGRPRRHGGVRRRVHHATRVGDPGLVGRMRRGVIGRMRWVIGRVRDVGRMQMVVVRCVDVPHRVLRRCVRLVRGHATIGVAREMGCRRRAEGVLGPWLTGSMHGAGGMCLPGRVSGADDAVTLEFARSECRPNSDAVGWRTADGAGLSASAACIAWPWLSSPRLFTWHPTPRATGLGNRRAAVSVARRAAPQG